VVTGINEDGTGLPIGCGDDAAFDDDSGHTDVYRGGKSGKKCHSATHLEWWPESDNESLLVDVSMRVSPGKGHKSPAYAPTSCGALYLNNGAVAFELDPDTGDVLGPLMETNALCIAAIPDDGNLDYTGAGDYDQDGAEDWAEACDIGTDPCNPDTDGDGVLDGDDECPLEGPADPGAGEILDPNGCIRQSQCSDGVDNDDDGLIDLAEDPGCDDIIDDDEFNAVCDVPFSCGDPIPECLPGSGAGCFCVASTEGVNACVADASCGALATCADSSIPAVQEMFAWWSTYASTRQHLPRQRLTTEAQLLRDSS